MQRARHSYVPSNPSEADIGAARSILYRTEQPVYEASDDSEAAYFTMGIFAPGGNLPRRVKRAFLLDLFQSQGKRHAGLGEQTCIKHKFAAGALSPAVMKCFI
jgi:hypothetical protein